MAISIVKPVTGDPMGWGCHVTVHESDAISIGDVIVGALFCIGGSGVSIGLAGAVGAINPSTHDTELIWGLKYDGNVVAPPNYIGGLALGGLVSMHLTFQHGFTPVHDAFFTDFYVHDPVSQIGYFLSTMVGGGGGHDPMLDDILAAVRVTFPTT